MIVATMLGSLLAYGLVRSRNRLSPITNVMMLVPRTRAEYRSLKVWFDTRDSLARRFEITEHNGSVRRFDLSGLRTNTAVPADVFRFTPPAGVRIVRVG